MGLTCGNNRPDCSLYRQGESCGKFQADSDIAGIGVIAAFVSTSLINLTTVFVAHLLCLLRGYESNAIDGWIFPKLQKIRLLRLAHDRKEFWRPIVERLVLLLSDYQLLFGVAILIAGYWKHCSISVYHFSIVVDLAWFSNTHMTSLSVLKCYFQERKTLRNWRVFMMVVMGLMMLAAIVLASRFAWAASLPCPAQCLFDESELTFAQTYPYVVALVLHYGTSIWRVFDTSCLDYYLLSKPRMALNRYGPKMERQTSNSSKQSLIRTQGASAMATLKRWLYITIIRIYLGFAAVFGSLTISLYYDILWFSLGLYGILWNWDIPSSEMDGDEHQLSFGQIMSMLMVASILLTFKEAYTEQKLNASGIDLERGEVIEMVSSSSSQVGTSSRPNDGRRNVGESIHRDIIISMRTTDEKHVLSC